MNANIIHIVGDNPVGVSGTTSAKSGASESLFATLLSTISESGTVDAGTDISEDVQLPVVKGVSSFEEVVISTTEVLGANTSSRVQPPTNSAPARIRLTTEDGETVEIPVMIIYTGTSAEIPGNLLSDSQPSRVIVNNQNHSPQAGLPEQIPVDSMTGSEDTSSDTRTDGLSNVTLLPQDTVSVAVPVSTPLDTGIPIADPPSTGVGERVEANIFAPLQFEISQNNAVTSVVEIPEGSRATSVSVRSLSAGDGGSAALDDPDVSPVTVLEPDTSGAIPTVVTALPFSRNLMDTSGSIGHSAGLLMNDVTTVNPEHKGSMTGFLRADDESGIYHVQLNDTISISVKLLETDAVNDDQTGRLHTLLRSISKSGEQAELSIDIQSVPNGHEKVAEMSADAEQPSPEAMPLASGIHLGDHSAITGDPFRNVQVAAEAIDGRAPDGTIIDLEPVTERIQRTIPGTQVGVQYAVNNRSDDSGQELRPQLKATESSDAGRMQSSDYQQSAVPASDAAILSRVERNRAGIVNPAVIDPVVGEATVQAFRADAVPQSAVPVESSEDPAGFVPARLIQAIGTDVNAVTVDAGIMGADVAADTVRSEAVNGDITMDSHQDRVPANARIVASSTDTDSTEFRLPATDTVNAESTRSMFDDAVPPRKRATSNVQTPASTERAIEASSRMRVTPDERKVDGESLKSAYPEGPVHQMSSDTPISSNKVIENVLREVVGGQDLKDTASLGVDPVSVDRGPRILRDAVQGLRNDGTLESSSRISSTEDVLKPDMHTVSMKDIPIETVAMNDPGPKREAGMVRGVTLSMQQFQDTPDPTDSSLLRDVLVPDTVTPTHQMRGVEHDAAETGITAQLTHANAGGGMDSAENRSRTEPFASASDTSHATRHEYHRVTAVADRHSGNEYTQMSGDSSAPPTTAVQPASGEQAVSFEQMLFAPSVEDMHTAPNPDASSADPVAREILLAGIGDSNAPSKTATLDTAKGAESTGTSRQAELAGRQEQIMSSIVRHARIMMQDGRSSATIRLEPPSLGKITLDIVTDHHRITGRIVVEKPEVREVVQNNLTELRETLAQNGLKVESFDVQVGHNGGTDNWARRQLFESQRSMSSRRVAGAAAVSDMNATEPVPGRMNRSIDSGGVDIWI